MGYLPQFTNDIFISYRHASNDAHDKWIDSFCEELRARLAELVGEVQIWRDNPEIRAGDQWRPEIVAALDTAAIFLAIISKTYLDSNVCRNELDHFLGCAKNEAAQRRIVRIFKQPPKSEQEFPQELGEMHHHEFYQWNPPGSDRFQELGPGKDDAIARQYWETFERLAQDLMDQLETLKGIARKNAVCTVYLASVGPELNSEREKLRSDLLQRGYLIVPEREYLWNASDFREKIVADLEAAKVSVHLVASIPSIVPETPKRARIQLELATETMKHREKPLPLVWVQPADKPDAAASDLIDYVKKELANEGVEYWQGSLEDFKTQICKKLPKPQKQTASKSTNEIALILEESDLALTGGISSQLVDKLGVETNRIKFTGTVPKDPATFKKALDRCDKCIVFWKTQSEDWVRAVLAIDALAGHIGQERLCVYAAAQTTEEQKTFRTTKARVILAVPEGNEAELREFLTTSIGVR